jgi:hypothetical protein
MPRSRGFQRRIDELGPLFAFEKLEIAGKGEIPGLLAGQVPSGVERAGGRINSIALKR